MKKLSSVFLSAALLLCTCAACTPSAERQVRMENPPAETVSGAEQEVFEWTQLSDKSVSSESAEYVRGAAEVAASTKYAISATVRLTQAGNDYRIGINAASNEIGQNMDFVYASANGGEFASYATLYGAEKRYDLGYKRVLTGEVDLNGGVSFTAIRDGETFYFLIDGVLQQIRTFDIGATVPGFSVWNCTGAFTQASYSDNVDEVDAVIAFCREQSPGGGAGNIYSNFAGLQLDETSVTFPEVCQQKPFEYTKTAFAGSYAGDVTVTFTTANLKPNASYDTASNLWPKLALLLNYGNGYEDMLCIGVGKKQDRMETYLYNDFPQWYNHTDFTGNTDTTSIIDRDGEIDFRIEIGNTGYSKTFRIYVNGALFALRTSKSNGDVSFGFASEYVSGEIKNFKVQTAEESV